MRSQGDTKDPGRPERPRVPPAVPSPKQRAYEAPGKNTKLVRQPLVNRPGHPEPGIPIPLSGHQRKPTVLPGRHKRNRLETHKNPAAGSIPGHRYTHRP